jgi:hypothetical protein
VEELFSEVTLGLGCLEERVRAPIGQPRLRKVCIVRWYHQLLDATDLIVDEPAQLRGAGALGRGYSVAQDGHGYSREDGQDGAEGAALCVVKPMLGNR